MLTPLPDTGPERQSGRKAQTANIVAAKVSLSVPLTTSASKKGRRAKETLVDRGRCHPNMSRTKGDAQDDPRPYGRYPVCPLSTSRKLADENSLTNDGHAILREIDVAHPAAKSMIELSRTQDEEVGDGTTSVIILGVFGIWP